MNILTDTRKLDSFIALSIVTNMKLYNINLSPFPNLYNGFIIDQNPFKQYSGIELNFHGNRPSIEMFSCCCNYF